MSEQPVVSVYPSSFIIDREGAGKALKARVPKHLRGLMEAVRDFACGFTWVHQNPFEPVPALQRTPGVTLIGDDLLHAAGPSGFHQDSLKAALRDCAFVAVITTEPVALPYNAAATCVVRDRKNAVVIDTQPEQKDAWLALIREVNPLAGVMLTLPEGMIQC